MLNELMYCERLMYLEWVQGEFADNVFTVDGRAVHRRVDKPGRPRCDRYSRTGSWAISNFRTTPATPLMRTRVPGSQSGP